MNELQEKELDVLKEVIKIIERHKLRYYAIGGTCLGAIRHHGFIPWDDDIDIGMPREDYELFRMTLYKELPEKYQKLDCDNSKRHTFLFTKIYNSETTFVENYAKDSPDRYTGVFVDVMPLDGLPSENAKKVIKKSQRLKESNRRTRKMPIDYIRTANFFKFLARKCMSVMFKYNYFSTRWKNLLSQYPFEKSDMVYFSWRDEKSALLEGYKVAFPYSYFADYDNASFEDITIRVPIRYNDYLTDDFGNYMELPPVEKRNSGHNVFICDLNTPCAYYAKLREEGKL